MGIVHSGAIGLEIVVFPGGRRYLFTCYLGAGPDGLQYSLDVS